MLEVVVVTAPIVGALATFGRVLVVTLAKVPLPPSFTALSFTL
jgi:hypothetical protein